MPSTHSIFTSLLVAIVALAGAAAAQKMPRTAIVVVPAIADGLCVGNLFQSHMVLQSECGSTARC